MLRIICRDVSAPDRGVSICRRIVTVQHTVRGVVSPAPDAARAAIPVVAAPGRHRHVMWWCNAVLIVPSRVVHRRPLLLLDRRHSIPVGHGRQVTHHRAADDQAAVAVVARSVTEWWLL